MSELWRRLAAALGRRDAASDLDLERILLEADFGPEAPDALLARLSGVAPDRLQAQLEVAVAGLLTDANGNPPGVLARAAQPPTVIVVLGVNGVGKTTTVAKLANRLVHEGRRVLLAAADTFRAGAAAQLAVWADRLAVPLVRGGAGADPAAVAFDALAAAVSRGSDTVLIDTAGRLHTEADLLEELKKVVRVAAKRHPAGEAPHEVLLVLDVTVGQNAVAQARAFAAALPLSGLVVTKLDGTARGGSVVALRRAVPVPVRFIGTGEALEDLEPFDAVRYARRVVGR